MRSPASIENLGSLTDRRAAEQRERDVIKKSKPRYNVTHNERGAPSEPSDRSDGWNVGPLAFMEKWHDAVAALDALARELDRNERQGKPTPSRRDFLAAVANVSETLVYGDCCDSCGEVRHPVALRVVDGWATCGYLCPSCRTRWTSGWTTDLANLSHTA